MSDKQPNALRLAAELSGDVDTDWLYEIGIDSCAAELRRLHALCEEIGEALKAAQTPLLHLYNAYGWPDKAGVRGKVDNALAKWEESK